ncbi:MAG: tRNA (guanosine(46)-N7)-methyltransferase TrmB [Rhizobiaceae bacterium]|nr:tRNA (guanosine(46)-N7)-methyltransferase TrmB [Rhizobiaceae bacterium]
MSSQHKSRATESFYGRRKGQQLRGRKQRVMDELLPKLRFDLSAPLRGELSDAFPAAAEKVHLEIGFGGGEHLAHQARSHPDINFIGVEPFINGMAKILGVIEDEGLSNIRLYDDDATQLLDWLPEQCVDQIDLLYPDPWPKKRHWKRRFVSQNNLQRFWRVLKPGGRFRFASDIDTYVNWILQHIHAHGKFTWTAESAADWTQAWDGWLRTRYEAKAIREGRPPCYLVFEKQ